MSNDDSIAQRLFNSLQSPDLVAGFQKYFGVYRLKADDDGEDESYLRTSICLQEIPDNTSAASHRLRRIEHKSDSSLDSSDTGSSSDNDVSKACYIIKNKFWYYLFCFGASLGYELFYASFFPIWFWNIDGAVGRRMVLVWVIIMYIGQALKDVIRWPRPACPPVISLEPEYAIEYGMPSTHAMVGIALPFSMLIFTVHRYEVRNRFQTRLVSAVNPRVFELIIFHLKYSLWYGVAFAVCWCALVCGSRLYLGMHSALVRYDVDRRDNSFNLFISTLIGYYCWSHLGSTFIAYPGAAC